MQKQMTDTMASATQSKTGYMGPIAMLVFALSQFSTVDAAEWRLEPVLRVASDYDDNPFLSTRTDVGGNASGYIAEGSANIIYSSDRTNFRITPRVRSRAYGSYELQPGDPDASLDSDDQFLTMNIATRTQSTDFRFRANYNRESTRTAERADTDFDIEDTTDIIDDQSGQVGFDDNQQNLIRGRRERLILTPSVLYRLSNVSALSARLDYQDVTYAEELQTNLVDYTDTRLNLSYSRAFSSRNTGIVGLTYRTYDTDNNFDSVDGVGFNIGFDRRLSETTRFRAQAGLEDTELVNADNELAWVTDLSLSRQLETINLLAQYRRSVSASGNGQLGARDSINFNFTRELNDKISAGLGARVYSTKAVSSNAQNFDDQDYVQLRSQFTWNISEVFSIEANYRYTILDRERLGESSNSNEITVWFTYQPRPITRSW